MARGTVLLVTALGGAASLILWLWYQKRKPTSAHAQPLTEEGAAAASELPAPSVSSSIAAEAAALEPPRQIARPAVEEEPSPPIPKPLPEPPSPSRLERTCLACGTKGTSLKRCSRCKAVHFCGRACQLRAFKEGHQGAACRLQAAPASAEPSRSEEETEAAALLRYKSLMTEAAQLSEQASVSGLREAASVYAQAASTLASRADYHLEALRMQAHSLLLAGEVEAAAVAAAQTLAATTTLSSSAALTASLQVEALVCCGAVLMRAASERDTVPAPLAAAVASVAAQRSGDTAPPDEPMQAAFCFLSAAVALCAGAERGVRPEAEAMARGNFSRALFHLEHTQEAIRQQRLSVGLRRQVLESAEAPGSASSSAKAEARRALSAALTNLGAMLNAVEEEPAAEAAAAAPAESEALWREGLKMAKESGVGQRVQRAALTNLINAAAAGEEAETPASAGEADESLRLHAEFSELLCQSGREGQTSCAICLAGFDEAEDAGGRPFALGCGHTFHYRCAMRWLERRSSCPLCQQPMKNDLTY